ncbi:hypothetical protein TNCV_4895531 [Trichonephila clavipes]|nr:hypothetical protein TNCV_4895531 [Trichonephila clavipes]
MPCRRHGAFFEQVSEFTPGRIADCSDCGLSFREIDQPVGLIYWFHCHTPRVRIAGTLNSQCHVSCVIPFVQRLPSAVFQQDNAWPHLALNVQEIFFTHQTERAGFSPDLSPIKTCGPCLPNDCGPGYTTRGYIRSTLAKCGSHMDSKHTSKASLILCRGMWQCYSQHWRLH